MEELQRLYSGGVVVAALVDAGCRPHSIVLDVPFPQLLHDGPNERVLQDGVESL